MMSLLGRREWKGRNWEKSWLLISRVYVLSYRVGLMNETQMRKGEKMSTAFVGKSNGYPVERRNS